MVQNYQILEDSFVLNWNKEIHDLFIDELEKQHDLGKYSDIQFKLRVWVYCIAEV